MVNISKLQRPVSGKPGIDYRVTQGWGADFQQRNKAGQLYWFYKSMGFNGHMGVDYAGPVAGVLLKIYAAHDGVVVWSGEEAGWGNHIRIQSGDEFQTNYAHLSEIYVKKGQVVKTGELIGKMGNTGTGTGPHLHFGLRPVHFNSANGFKGYIDPTSYVVAWPETPVIPEKPAETAQSFWEKITHYFTDYTSTKPLTEGEAKKLIDMGINGAIQSLKK